jgi:sulfur carrier protein
MTISVNGESREIAPDTTVANLLAKLELNAQFVAVEVNLELVPRTMHADQKLCPADRVEIVTLVGGG